MNTALARRPAPLAPAVHCRYHGGTPLVRVPCDRPFLGYSLSYGQSHKARAVRATWKRNKRREILRCPVPGCPRVAPLPGEEMADEELAS